MRITPGEQSHLVMPEMEINVEFQPLGKKVMVPVRSTVLQAARSAGAGLLATCGGQSSCGTCVVRLVSGSPGIPGAPFDIRDYRYPTEVPEHPPAAPGRWEGTAIRYQARDQDLLGAKQSLLAVHKRAEASIIAKKIEYLELATDSSFTEAFAQAMLFEPDPIQKQG